MLRLNGTDFQVQSSPAMIFAEWHPGRHVSTSLTRGCNLNMQDNRSPAGRAHSCAARCHQHLAEVFWAICMHPDHAPDVYSTTVQRRTARCICPGTFICLSTKNLGPALLALFRQTSAVHAVSQEPINDGLACATCFAVGRSGSWLVDIDISGRTMLPYCRQLRL